MNAKQSNAPTDKELIAEAQRLFLEKIIAGLQDPKPRASFLAVVQKYLAEHAGQLAPTPPAASNVQPENLPFPAKGAAGANATRVSPLGAPLEVPFKAPAK